MGNKFRRLTCSFGGMILAFVVSGNAAAGVMLESVKTTFANGWFIELFFDDTVYEAPPFPVGPFDPKESIVSVSSNAPIDNSLPVGGYLGVVIQEDLEVVITSFFLQFCSGLYCGIEPDVVGGVYLSAFDTSLDVTECLEVADGICTDESRSTVAITSKSGIAREASASVPAPATLALVGLGLAGLGWPRRRKE